VKIETGKSADPVERFVVVGIPIPPGILKKRLQAIENKRRECEKDAEESERGCNHMIRRDLPGGRFCQPDTIGAGSGAVLSGSTPHPVCLRKCGR
jgi:hypothetical protein